VKTEVKLNIIIILPAEQSVHLAISAMKPDA
jgi:hypothetical protein